MAIIDGKQYTLAQLLGGNVELEIPDMQRDYAWGEQALRFTLLFTRLYAKRKSSSFGFFYGSEQPKGSGHILVIDGHQRITTLYLMLGMLYRRTPTDELRQMLISDYQLIDKQEPTLRYQSRSEAQYFLSDLVTRFFLNRDGRLSQLEQSDWYYQTYEADTNIKNFIAAIRSIDKALEHAAATYPDWDFGGFAEFVAHKLLWVYCELGPQPEAEKTFLTINTTSQPMTLSEKLRSLTLDATDDAALRMEYAMAWNDVEDWFWRYRSEASFDDAVALFCRMEPEAAEQADLKAFFTFFEAYRRLFHAVKDATGTFASLGSQWQDDFRLIPSLRYIHRFGSRASDRDLMRLWHMLTNVLRYQKPSQSGSDTEAASSVVKFMTSPDILSLLKLQRVSDRVLTQEERAKLQFIERHINRREDAAQALARAEAHPMLNGRASRLIAWTEKAPDQIAAFEKYCDAIYRLWGNDIDRNEALDTVRRALLTMRSDDYPIVRRGDTVLSLCWFGYDWQRLMQQAPGLIRQLIERSFTASLDDIIARASDRQSPYFPLISRPHLLEHCSRRMLLRPCEAFLGMHDYELDQTRWLVDQTEMPVDIADWSHFRTYGSKCLYADHDIYNVAIDLYFTPDQRSRYRVEVFSRKDAADIGGRQAYNLKPLLSDLRIPFTIDRHRSRFVTYFPTAKAAITAIRRIMTTKLDNYARTYE